MQWLAIVLLSVLACVSYGIVHDQITARVCVEYFTIGHPIIVPTEDPTLLGIVWGVVATWWVGVLVGVPLAAVARLGNRPQFTARMLLGPIAALMACTAVLAATAGSLGYRATLAGRFQLFPHLAERIPAEKHALFAADLWAHNASYLGGFVGGALVMLWVWRARGRAAQERNANSGELPS